MSFKYNNEVVLLFEMYNNFYADYKSQVGLSFTLFKALFYMDFSEPRIIIRNNRSKTLYLPFKYKSLPLSFK